MYLCIPMKEISENKQHADEAAPAKHREHYGNNGNGSFNNANLLGYGVLKVCGKKAEMVAMGVIDLRKVKDVYLKLGRIHERVNSLIASFLPDELSIESQFYGNNPQSMLKLGRAQGVAIAAAINRDVPIHEYAPLKIKMAITGNGRASKEQVAAMLQRYLGISNETLLPYLDATDALAAAYCHFIESYCKVYETTGKNNSAFNVSGNFSDIPGKRHTTKWADFVKNNPGRVGLHPTNSKNTKCTI